MKHLLAKWTWYFKDSYYSLPLSATIAACIMTILVPRAHDQELRPGPTMASNLANLIGWEKYSKPTLKIGYGQSSRSLPKARRIVGSGDENGHYDQSPQVKLLGMWRKLYSMFFRSESYTNNRDYSTLNSLTHFWLAESAQWIFEISARDVIAADNKQLLDEVEHDIMNYQNRGLCYLPKPKAEADNTDTRFW